jgi:LmbE family N-acetylglucosaminyl deacetylase
MIDDDTARMDDAPLVVLSPHLDDAVLSVGGIIAAAPRVTVVTCFAGTPDADAVPPRLRPFARYEVRLAEDDRALALLGASRERLGFIERAFRAPPLDGAGALFRAPPAQENVAALVTALRAVLQKRPDARLLAPLAVGGHVDHVEVFLAALTLALDGAPVRFYEDVYALVRAARRRHFVTRRLPWPRVGSPEQRALRPFLFARALGWAMRGPSLESLVPAPAREAEWRVERMPIGPHEPAKLAAVAAYASQLRGLGGRGCLRAIRRYHAIWDGAEPVWSVSLSSTAPSAPRAD